MIHKNEILKTKETMNMVKDFKVAVCGNLPAACKTLRDIGVSKIDKYGDGLELSFALRNGAEYHLVLVYAPQGEGIDGNMPYKIVTDDEWQSVPIKLLNEPACSSALIELQTSVLNMAENRM